MSLEQLIFDNVMVKKNGKVIVEEGDQAILTSLMADFVSSLVYLSGYQLTTNEIVEKMKGIEFIRFSSFPEEKEPHGIIISLESPEHSIYQLNLGLIEEILNDKAGFSFRKKEHLEEQVGSTCYQGIIHDMAERVVKESYPKFHSSPKRASSFWTQSEIMGVLVDVIGEEPFFTNIVRNPVGFFKKMNLVTYQEESLHQYLDTHLQAVKKPADVESLVTNDKVVDCVEAISESQAQLANQFIKYK